MSLLKLFAELDLAGLSSCEPLLKLLYHCSILGILLQLLGLMLLRQQRTELIKFSEHILTLRVDLIQGSSQIITIRLNLLQG